MEQSLTVTKLTHFLIVGALLIGVCSLIGTSTAEAQNDTGPSSKPCDRLSHLRGGL